MIPVKELSDGELSAAINYLYEEYSHRKTDLNVNRMKKESGNVKGNLLETFMYHLMRDKVTPGYIEGLLLELSNQHDYKTTDNKDFEITNGWLGKYAKDVSKRLMANIKTGSKVK